MPAKTLEQLTAKYQDFLDPAALKTWKQFRELSDKLRRIDQEIAQQKNVEKRSGLQSVKLQLQACRDTVKASLPRETKHQRAMDDAERDNAADANALEASFKREKKLEKETRAERRIQKVLMRQGNTRERDTNARARRVHAGEPDEELPMDADEDSGAGVPSGDAAAVAPVADEPADAAGLPSGDAAAAAPVADEPADGAGVPLGAGMANAGAKA